jgi:capsular polysaccharide export protein
MAKAPLSPHRCNVTQQLRSFLLLQGPPGPLFLRVGEALRKRGHRVCRVNLGGGDRLDWPEGAIDYRGTFSEWPTFIDRLLREQSITDLLLFGDCRPYHVKAHGIAKLRGVQTFVLEEGYLRPHWMTLELDGVNARSSLRGSKQWFLTEAARLEEEPPQSPIGASFKRRARDSYWYYHHVVTGRLRYPHYRSHRRGSIVMDGLGWLWRLARQKRREALAEETWASLRGEKVFLFPLQLSGDFQIRAHSPFADMQGAAAYVIESFALHAPGDAHLLIKRHPLDSSFFNWGGFIARLAGRLKIQSRVHFIDGGNLDEMAAETTGLICVNSTSATLALARGKPVCAIGDAIYKMDGLTHCGHVDDFWSQPSVPEPGLYEAFRKVLVDRCLVRGGLASESAVETLVEGMLDRMAV